VKRRQQCLHRGQRVWPCASATSELDSRRHGPPPLRGPTPSRGGA
jgi:hypothetical protein